jgi:predicted DNA-binding transcriptional regulator YafY
LNRRRVKLIHFNRQSGQTSEREVSPQRLTFYRDNWYLDSWCHLRKAIRSFAVDALQQVEPLPMTAKEISEQELDHQLRSGYGIFSGSEVQWTTLKFTPSRARWIASEQWHPQQRSHYDEQGYFYLSLPYSQEPELLMDILKHGPEVEVLEPQSLRSKVAATVKKMMELY